MIARLLFLVAALGALLFWLAWTPAPEAPAREESGRPAVKGDFDPLLPEEARDRASAVGETPRTPTTPRGTVQATRPRNPNDGTILVRLEGVGAESRWMVHLEEVSLGSLRPLSLPAIEGVARVESLPLGGNYEVLAIDEDARQPARRARVEGPRATGDVVELSLPAPQPVHVRAQLRDADGTPVRQSPIEWLVVHGDHARVGQEWATGRTDDEGYLVAELGHPEGSATARALWVRTTGAGRDRRGGKVDLRDPLPRGETTVAAIEVVPEPLLASGRVVDSEGRSTGQRGFVDALAVDKEGEIFAPNPPLVGRFGKDGVFEIHGFVTSGEIVLRPKRSGDDAPKSLVPEADVRVAIGATDVLLRYVEPGAITGSVRIDKVTPPHRVDLHVAPEGRDEGVTIEPDADGKFAALQLPPGLYRVWCTSPDDPLNPVFDVHDVVVTSGETTRDARLSNVDARGRLRRVQLVFDRAMNLVPYDGRCRLTRRDSGTSWDRAFHGPSFQLTLTEAAYDLEVHYGNFAPVRLIDVRGDQHLPLRRGRSLVLRLVDPENLPPASTAKVRARLRPEGDEGDLPAREAWLSETRTRVSNLPPGRWRIQLDLVRREGARDEPWSPIHSGLGPVVEIPNEGDVEFALDLDEVALIEALARLGD